MKAGYSNDLFLSSSLVIFYGKSGCLEGAHFVFGQLTLPNIVRKSVLMKLLVCLRRWGGVKMNSFTFSSVLKACRKLTDDGYYGRQVHAKAIKLGVNLKSYVQCGLVDMYGKFGLVRNARRVFEMNGVKKNAACWNAMLNAYIQHASCIEVVKVLYVMKGGGLEPRESLVNAVWNARFSSINCSQSLAGGSYLSMELWEHLGIAIPQLTIPGMDIATCFCALFLLTG
ncbi:unnamed protein product [Ilex paraguariensis]|uniref:Pentatricopeptide repeat-containing protein n=1 Tax=Ilex paraguariensis TaxID=185542 RepID=A0ABC8S7S4_9AQUA